jgi:hypothetical protein
MTIKLDTISNSKEESLKYGRVIYGHPDPGNIVIIDHYTPTIIYTNNTLYQHIDSIDNGYLLPRTC